MSDYLGESEEKLAQPRFAQRAVIAKPTSRSKSKTRVAIVSGATLVLGIFFALRSQKHKVDSTAAGAEDHSVIVHVGTAYQGDMGVYIDALGTVTPDLYGEHLQPGERSGSHGALSRGAVCTQG